jgi:O-antigen/teichoic acid export membrane protein
MVVKWSVFEKISQYAIQLILILILSRFLDPEDFGLIAILNVFTIMAGIVVEGGFSQALISKIKCTNEDYNSVFWFNFLVSVLLYIILFFSAQEISNFFKDYRIDYLAKILFLIIPLGATSIVQQTMLIKDLNFKLLAIFSFLSNIISGITGILLAYWGYGVQSIVYQQLVNVLIQNILLWLKSNWRPKLSFRIDPIRNFMSYSTNILASNFINNLFNNIYPLTISRYFSQFQLGLYSQSYRFSSQPSILLDAVINRVSFPILASLKENILNFKYKYSYILSKLFLYNLPISFLLILLAHDLIFVLLGPKWMNIVIYFQLISVASLTFPIHPLTMVPLKVFDKTSLILKLEILKKIVLVITIFITLKFGFLYLILGQSLYFLIILPINMYFGGAIIDYSIKDQLKDVIPYIFSSIVALGLTFFFNSIFGLSSYLNIIFSVLIFSLIYIVLLKFLLKKTIVSIFKVSL